MNPSLEVRFHEGYQMHFLYLDAGTDPSDGAPMTLARPATNVEVFMWEMGDLEGLRKLVNGQREEAKPVYGVSPLRKLFGVWQALRRWWNGPGR